MPLEPASPSRDEQLAALLASPPPRVVPAELRRAAVRQASTGPLGLVGVIFTLVGLLFVAIFSPWDILQDWRLASAETTTVQGKVTAVDRTNMSVNKQRVMRYDFAFQHSAGVRMRGECFTTGARWRNGDDVTVKFSVSHPELCCIEGARLSQGGNLVLIVCLFPALGLSFLISTIVGRWRLRWLLANGAVAEARVTALEETMTRINRQQVYRITLQRTDPVGGPAFVLRKYQLAQVDFARQRLETKQPVFVLYDPAHPKRALLPEAL